MTTAGRRWVREGVQGEGVQREASPTGSKVHRHTMPLPFSIPPTLPPIRNPPSAKTPLSAEGQHAPAMRYMRYASVRKVWLRSHLKYRACGGRATGGRWGTGDCRAGGAGGP